MTQKSRSALLADVLRYIFTNVDEDITGDILAQRLNDIIDSFYNKTTDSSVVILVGGFLYWTPGADPANPVAGDIREGMVGTDLQLQEYNGTSWDIRGDR